MAIAYNPTKHGVIQNSMSDEGAIRLPFPVFTANIINGDPQKVDLKANGDPRLFGGFKFSADKNDVEIAPDNNLPSGYKLVDVWSKDKGKFYKAYLGRHLYVAPIARRFGWFHNDKKGTNSSAVQVLCLMANKVDAGLSVCGVVILSAGSYSGVALDKAFQRFDQATRKQRAELGNIPAHYFWRKIGTMGADIQQVMRGKTEKSPITPVYLFGDDPECKTAIDKLAGVYTTALVEKTYVGEAVADKMTEIYSKSGEWLSDWKNKAGKKDEAAPLDVAEIVSHADPATGEIDDF